VREDGKIDYVEFSGDGLATVKTFYGKAFGWRFVDYGDDYAAFEQAGVEGGFRSDDEGRGKPPLVVLYAHDLEAMLAKVEQAGGEISAPIFSFPGGRRFHFRDPAGNELAVWSEA